MAIFKPYSQREKERLGCVPDVYEYITVSQPLRNQIIKIWDRFFGNEQYENFGGSKRNPGWKALRSDVAEHCGERTINPGSLENRDAICSWFSKLVDGRLAIDVIDISVNVMVKFNGWKDRKELWEATRWAPDAIEEINERFRQHHMGYEFIAGSPPLLIRKDNEHLHKEAVLPALNLLHDLAFKGADDEYRSAHRHYLEGDYKECLVDCLKSFESTMKTICDRRGWPHKPTDTASALIKICLDNGLLHGFLDSHLTPLRTGLEGSIPTLRNKMGGHGQGEEVKVVPRFYAEYLLHETAVSIVLLVEAFKALQTIKP